MRRKQRGWIGMVVLLIALAIVAYLAKDALMKYGLLSPAETTATTGERPRSQAERTDSTTVPPTPVNALERAKGLQDTLKQESEKRGTQY